MATFSPLATVTVMVSTTASSASVAARLLPSRDSRASTSCPLFTAVPLQKWLPGYPPRQAVPSSDARLVTDGRTTDTSASNTRAGRTACVATGIRRRGEREGGSERTCADVSWGYKPCGATESHWRGGRLPRRAVGLEPGDVVD